MTTLVSTRKAFHAPDDLTELDQWLLWRYENSTKVPYSTAGRRASSTDPASWCSYDEALEAWHRNSGRWTGIGFVFHESDPFVGIDLDDSLDEHANPKPWARGIVERFADTYCEISPSEHGLKIWCRGNLPTNLGKVAVGDGGIEMYSRARFFTVCCDKRHPEEKTAKVFAGAVGARRRFIYPAALYPQIFDAIEASISFQSFTNDPAASRWRSVYLQLKDALNEYLNQATERIIREEVFGDAREARERTG